MSKRLIGFCLLAFLVFTGSLYPLIHGSILTDARNKYSRTMKSCSCKSGGAIVTSNFTATQDTCLTLTDIKDPETGECASEFTHAYVHCPLDCGSVIQVNNKMPEVILSCSENAISRNSDAFILDKCESVIKHTLFLYNPCAYGNFVDDESENEYYTMIMDNVHVLPSSGDSNWKSYRIGSYMNDGKSVSCQLPEVNVPGILISRRAVETITFLVFYGYNDEYLSYILTGAIVGFFALVAVVATISKCLTPKYELCASCEKYYTPNGTFCANCIKLGNTSCLDDDSVKTNEEGGK